MHNFKELLFYNNNPLSLPTIEGIDPSEHFMIEMKDYQMRIWYPVSI